MLKLYVQLQNLLDRARDEEGQTVVEYALVIVLVSLVIAVSLAAINGGIANAVTVISDKLSGIVGS
jgi:Flp pilus assembly pilin Flp